MNAIDLFIAFFKIGILTIGGGYAMIPVIQKSVVEEHKWLTNTEFIDSLAISQSVPGAISINISVYIGYKLKGIKGAVIATLGTVLPSFSVIVIIATFFFGIREVVAVEKILRGVRAAVVSMIFMSFLKLLKTVEFKRNDYILMVLGMVILIVFGVNPVWIILVVGVLSIVIYNIKKVKR